LLFFLWENVFVCLLFGGKKWNFIYWTDCFVEFIEKCGYQWTTESRFDWDKTSVKIKHYFWFGSVCNCFWKASSSSITRRRTKRGVSIFRWRRSICCSISWSNAFDILSTFCFRRNNIKNIYFQLQNKTIFTRSKYAWASRKLKIRWNFVINEIISDCAPIIWLIR